MTKTSVIEMPTSRRSVLTTVGMGAALAATGATLSSCGAANDVLPGVIDAINKVIAQTCSIVPVVATIVDIIVTIFPQAAGVATVTDAVAKEIANFVCGLVTKAGFKEGQHPTGPYKAQLNASKSVDLHFYAISNGRMILV